MGRKGSCYWTVLSDGRAEFPLRSYGPNLGRAGDSCAIVIKPPKLVLLFINVSDTDTMKLKLKLIYDRQSVGQSVLVSGTHLRPATNFSFSLKFPLDSCGLVSL
jgi:hypothetical protein